MASLIKYFKKKFKPLKRCVGSSGQSFERNNRIASITRKDHDLANSQLTEYNDYSRVSATATTKQKRHSRISIFNSDEKDAKKKVGVNLFRKHNTENSLNTKTTTSYFGSPEKTANTINFQTPTAPNSSPTTNFSISMCSNDNYHQTNSNHNNDNMMNAQSNSDNNKYQESSEKANLVGGTAANSNNINLIVQQSTPFNDSLPIRNRKRSLRVQAKDDPINEQSSNGLLINNKKISTSNLNTPQVSSIEIDDRNIVKTGKDNTPNIINTNFNKNKCRRSITTYASNDNKKNRIIDYFNQMDLNSNKKINTRINNKSSRPSAQKASEDLFNNTANDTEDELEKIQDAFFIDDSIVNNSKDLKKRKSSRGSIGSMHSSIITESSVNINKTTAEKLADNFASKQKEAQSLVNNSIEKMRRSISMPGLNENNSTIFSNMSKISMIKDIEEEPTALNDNKDKSSSSPYCYEFHRIPLMNSVNNQTNDEKFSSRQSINNSSQPSNFIRGQPQTRMSRNIKDMFKNVVKYQMNALNCLEKFYESQINKLEIDRSCDLALNPENRDKINQYYDEQLKVLENRVHCSLNFICQKKPEEPTNMMASRINNSRYSSETGNFSKNSSMKMNDEQLEKLAQLILLKQMNEQKTSTNTRANRRGVSSKIQTAAGGQDNKQRTKSLSGLKINLMNQNSLLPSRRSIRTVMKPNSTIIDSINQTLDSKQSSNNNKNNENKNENESSQINPVEKSETELLVVQDEETENQFEDADYFFKRHLSLPYDRCGKKPPTAMKRTSNYEIKNMNNASTNQPRKSRFATLDYSSSKIKYLNNKSVNSDLMDSSSISSPLLLSAFASTSSMRSSDQSEQFARVSLTARLNELTNQLSYNRPVTNRQPSASNKANSSSSHYLKNKIQPKSLMYSVDPPASQQPSSSSSSSSLVSQQALMPSFHDMMLNDSESFMMMQQLSSYAQVKKLNRSPSSSNTGSEIMPNSFKRYSSQFQIKSSALMQKKETQV